MAQSVSHSESSQHTVHTSSISEPSKKIAAFFDIDQTTMRGASGWVATVALLRSGYVSPNIFLFAARQAALYALSGERINRIDSIVEKALSVAEGTHKDDIHAVIERMWDKQFRPRMYARTLQRINDHLKSGHEVWLVSATPSVVADVIAQKLGVTGAIATRLKYDKDGIHTGEIDGHFVHGPYKAQAVRSLAHKRHIDLEESWAYSDSAHDIPLLELVGNPVAVNADRVLAEYARRKNWERLEAQPRINSPKNVTLATAGLTILGGAYLLSRAPFSSPTSRKKRKRPDKRKRG